MYTYHGQTHTCSDEQLERSLFMRVQGGKQTLGQKMTEGQNATCAGGSVQSFHCSHHQAQQTGDYAEVSLFICIPA